MHEKRFPVTNFLIEKILVVLRKICIYGQKKSRIEQKIFLIRRAENSLNTLESRLKRRTTSPTLATTKSNFFSHGNKNFDVKNSPGLWAS